MNSNDDGEHVDIYQNSTTNQTTTLGGAESFLTSADPNLHRDPAAVLDHSSNLNGRNDFSSAVRSTSSNSGGVPPSGHETAQYRKRGGPPRTDPGSQAVASAAKAPEDSSRGVSYAVRPAGKTGETLAHPMTGTSTATTAADQEPLPQLLSHSDWVSLEVGGRQFTTTFTTLCSDPNSLLFTICEPIYLQRRRMTARRQEECRSSAGRDRGGGEEEESTWTSEASPHLLRTDTDSNSSILLDLDPDHFAPILNFLRHGELHIPTGVSSQSVLAVATYLNIQAAVDLLRSNNLYRRHLLFSWGSGSNGELGTQLLQDNPFPSAVQIVPFGSHVVQMALGANYSVARLSSGRVYTFGNGDWGQLGLGSPILLDEHPVDKSALVMVPRSVPLFETHKASYVAAGYAFAMAIVEPHHVYFWGNNNHGQSALGPKYFDLAHRKIESPCLVESLEGKKIVQLSCGSFFSLALAEDGRLYSWGLLECLGIGSPAEVRERFKGDPILSESLSTEKRTVVLSPQEVCFPKSESGDRCWVVRVHAGQWHSGAINDRGELFTWGVGYQGRLGHDSKEPAYVPTRVRGALEGHRVVEVTCSSFHTAALTDRGTVFCWGDNANGQCGLSNRSEAVLTPYRVVGLEFVAGGVARGISCGRQHTAVVMEGPQPGCTLGCCDLDARGKPLRSHQQIYVFGEVTGGVKTGSHLASGNETGMGVNASSVMAAATDTVARGAEGWRDGGVSVDLPVTYSQYQLVPGLLHYHIFGVVNGLHHTFVHTEEIQSCEAGERAQVRMSQLPQPPVPPSRCFNERSYLEESLLRSRQFINFTN